MFKDKLRLHCKIKKKNHQYLFKKYVVVYYPVIILYVFGYFKQSNTPGCIYRGYVTLFGVDLCFFPYNP